MRQRGGDRLAGPDHQATSWWLVTKAADDAAASASPTRRHTPLLLHRPAYAGLVAAVWRGRWDRWQHPQWGSIPCHSMLAGGLNGRGHRVAGPLLAAMPRLRVVARWWDRVVVEGEGLVALALKALEPAAQLWSSYSGRARSSRVAPTLGDSSPDLLHRFRQCRHGEPAVRRAPPLEQAGISAG